MTEEERKEYEWQRDRTLEKAASMALVGIIASIIIAGSLIFKWVWP